MIYSVITIWMFDLMLSTMYRFVNVDFATVKGLESWKELPFVVSSYDINCQYGKKFLGRVSSWIDTNQFPLLRRVVPKYHAVGHKQNCRYLHSFYFMPGVGMTDGEAPERRWAYDNAIARSTREMGDGHRHDAMNFHTADYNIQKTFRICEYHSCLKDMILKVTLV